MNIILIDDEPLSLKHFDFECKGIQWINVVGCFTNPYEAIEFAKANVIDCAVLDIEMPGMNGIECAHELNNIYPNLAIIFITGYDQYAFEAFEEQAIGYLLKPFEMVDLMPLLDRARILNSAIKPNTIIHTFGRFDIFVKEQVVAFKSSKAKELLALCVEHKGGVVSMEEAIDKLWPEKEYDEKVKNLYRKAVSSVRITLEKYGVESLFVSVRGSCYINKRLCNCDYFDFLDGKDIAYSGEFLFDYDWSERTNAQITQKVMGITG